VKKRRILWAVPAVLGAYLLWVGYHIARFKPYRVESAAGGQEIEGVYHVHSAFSDGRASVESIARAAAGAGLQFIILTDHGNPNRPSLDSQGWKSGVLVLAGSELSVSRGHLVALDFRQPDRPFAQNAEESMRSVRRLGGFTVIAHPFSKVRWNFGGPEDPAGIEIINGDTEIKRRVAKSLFWFPALLVSPRLALIKMLDSPVRNLAKWDELTSSRRVYGYFSADAHVLYGSLFNFLRLHLFLKQPLSSDFETARAQVFEALRSGKFYNAVDAAGQARGFRFWAAIRDRRMPMGSTLPPAESLTLEIRAPYDFPKEIRLMAGGRTLLSSSLNSVSYPVSSPGAYRVEVYLKGRTPLAEDIPWIVSNPIFVREERP
jgi:hypothetical protein